MKYNACVILCLTLVSCPQGKGLPVNRTSETLGISISPRILEKSDTKLSEEIRILGDKKLNSILDIVDVQINSKSVLSKRINSEEILLSIPKKLIDVGFDNLKLVYNDGFSKNINSPTVLEKYVPGIDEYRGIEEGKLIVSMPANHYNEFLQNPKKLSYKVERSAISPGLSGVCQNTFVEISDTIKNRNTVEFKKEIDDNDPANISVDPKTIGLGHSVTNSPNAFADPGPNDNGGQYFQFKIARGLGISNLLPKSGSLQSVIVAVLDTGVSDNSEMNSPGLILVGKSFTTEDLETNYDDVGFSLSSADGHGTGVAGIIAAPDGNGGIVGVAPGSHILPVKVCNKRNRCEPIPIIRGMCYVIDQKNREKLDIKVINASFGGNVGSENIKSVYQVASQSGIVVVASAGNNGLDTVLRDRPHYPAYYSREIPGMISVGSIVSSGGDNAYGALSRFSNTGNSYSGRWIDVFAPGEGVYTLSKTGYAALDGTSFAAPWVSGTAAILAAIKPSATPAEIKTAIVRSTSRFNNNAVGLTNVLDIEKAISTINR